VSYSYTGTGGATFGGTSAAARTAALAYAASGGATFGGAATAGQTTAFAYTPSGAMYFGGAGVSDLNNVPQPVAYSYTASGGAAFGGAATAAPTHTRSYTGSGVATFGGAATVDRTSAQAYSASGGLAFGGSGVTAFDEIVLAAYSYTGTGGATFAGSATAGVTHTQAYAGSGGFTFGGAAATTGGAPVAGDPGLVSLTVDGQPLAPLAFAATPTVVSAQGAQATIAWTAGAPCVSVLMQVENSFQQPWAIWTDSDYTPKTTRSVIVPLRPSTTYRFAVELADPVTNAPYQYPAPGTQTFYAFTTPALVTTDPFTWRQDVYGSKQAFPGMELYVVANGQTISGSSVNANEWLRCEDSLITITPATSHITGHWLAGRDDIPVQGDGSHWAYYGTDYAWLQVPNIRLTIDATCPPGTYTVNAPVTAHQDGSKKTVSWTFTVSPIPAINRPAAIPTPAIPGLANFWSVASSAGASYNQPLNFQYGFGVESEQWFYDGSRVLLQVGDGLADGNPNWDLQAQNEGNQYSTYILNNGGGLPMWRVFSSGLLMLYRRYGTQAYADALNALITGKNAMINSYPTVQVGYQRESALMLLAAIRQSQLSGVRYAGMTHCASIVANHLGQLAQGKIFDQPFFDGISLAALIAYYEYDPTATWVPAFIAWYLPYLWTNVVIDSGTDKYGWTVYSVIYSTLWPGCPKVSSIGNYHAQVNDLFDHAWAWMYNLTGDDTYRVQGDLMFEHHLDEPPYNGKQYSQTYMLGCDYVHYRSNAQLVKSLADPSNN
jgi:hypothetical protein